MTTPTDLVNTEKEFNDIGVDIETCHGGNFSQDEIDYLLNPKNRDSGNAYSQSKLQTINATTPVNAEPPFDKEAYDAETKSIIDRCEKLGVIVISGVHSARDYNILLDAVEDTINNLEVQEFLKMDNEGTYGSETMAIIARCEKLGETYTNLVSSAENYHLILDAVEESHRPSIAKDQTADA